MSQSSRECVSLVLMWLRYGLTVTDYPSHRKVGNLLPACDWLYIAAPRGGAESLDMRGSRAHFFVYFITSTTLYSISKRHR